jgi:hypothetical protein
MLVVVSSCGPSLSVFLVSRFSACAPSRRLTLHHSPSAARLQQKMRSVSSGQFQWPMPLIGLTPLTASSIFLAAGRTRLPMFHARLL